MRSLVLALAILAGLPRDAVCSPDARQTAALQSIVSATGEPPRYQADPTTGTVTFMTGRLSRPSPLPAREAAHSFLREAGALFGLSDPDRELEPAAERVDADGSAHVRFRQRWQGVEVWASELIVHLDRTGGVYCVTGRTHPSPELDVRPRVDSLAALRAVHALFPAATVVSLERAVYAWDRPPVLAWKARAAQGPERDRLVFLDARSGELLTTFDQVAHDGPALATGAGLDGTTRTLQVWRSGATDWLDDVSRAMFGPGDTPGDPVTANILTLDWPGGALISGTGGSFADPAAVDAHFFSGEFYEYLLAGHGRDSWDGAGASIVSNVHYGSSYSNAFWSWATQQMYYGDGDGVIMRPASGARDLVAHELTHGITGATSGLVYLDQSGALNESFSDILAMGYDTRNWTFAEDVTLPAPGFMRSMADPHLGFTVFPLPFGNQTAHMSEYLYAPFDNGGVHINSGIHNKAFYELAGLVGRADAVRILYRAFTTYLVPGSQFVDARNAAIQSAADLGLDTVAVATAYDLVGILPVTQDASQVLKYDLFDDASITNFGALPFVTTASPAECFALKLSPAYWPSHLMNVTFIYGAGQQGRTVTVSVRRDSAGAPGAELGRLDYAIPTAFAYAALVDFSTLGITANGPFQIVLSSTAPDLAVAWTPGYDNHRTLRGGGGAWTPLGAALGVRASMRYQRNAETGVRWAKQAAGTPQALRGLAVLSADEVWACGTAGTVLHTTTGGLVWDPVDVGTGGSLNSICFTGPLHGWMVGDLFETYRTTDGGATWSTAVNTSDNNLKCVRFANADSGFAAGNFGTVMRSTDGGASWTVQPTDTWANLYGVAVPGAGVIVAVGAYGTIERSDDGGETFGYVFSPAGATLYGVDFADAATGWAVGANGGIFKTTDGGASWEQQASPTGDALRSVFALSPTCAYAVGFYGALVRTLDGTTWEAEPSGIYDNLYAVAFASDGVGWLGGESGAILSARAAPVPAAVPPGAPLATRLEAARPNPFRGRIEIGFTLARPANVSLRIYDVAGKAVATLASGWRAPGQHRVEWAPAALPAGMYFCRFDCEGRAETRKMVALK